MKVPQASRLVNISAKLGVCWLRTSSCVRILGSDQTPGNQPEQADHTYGNEESTPTELRQNTAADNQAQRRTELRSGVDQTIGHAALLFGESGGDDLGIRRIRDGFAHSQHQTQQEQSRESVHQAGENGCAGPDKIADRVNPNYVVSFDKPPRQHHETGVGPKKSRKQVSELERIQMQSRFQIVAGDRQVPAIDVIDADRNDQEDQHNPLHARSDRFLRKRGAVHCTECNTSVERGCRVFRPCRAKVRSS